MTRQDIKDITMAKNNDGYKTITLKQLEEIKSELEKQTSVPIFLLQEKHLSSGEVKLRFFQINPSKITMKFMRNWWEK